MVGERWVDFEQVGEEDAPGYGKRAPPDAMCLPVGNVRIYHPEQDRDNQDDLLVGIQLDGVDEEGEGATPGKDG